jgi:hypothetical protein
MWGYVFEAHVFAMTAGIGCAVLFWASVPAHRTEPDPLGCGRLRELPVSLSLALQVFLGGTCTDFAILKRWKRLLVTGSVLFCLAIPAIWLCMSPDRFPTLASVLLMVIALGWLLAGLAFFLDRYSAPVLMLCPIAR